MTNPAIRFSYVPMRGGKTISVITLEKTHALLEMPAKYAMDELPNVDANLAQV